MSLNNTPTKYIWFNGQLVNYADAKVHVLSHALHYGTAVFEGIRAYSTPKGPCIFRLDEHIDRLFNSAKIYRFPVPYTKEQIKQACRSVIADNGLESGYIRPLIFLGEIGLGVRIPEGAQASAMVAAMPWGAYLGEEGLQKGVKVGVSSWNRLAPNTIPTEAKAAGNYLSSILISNEAHQNGYVEAIALDTDGFISEGSGENVFFVKDGAIYTAPFTNGLLPGITRNAIITLAKEVLHIPVYEQKLQREMCYLADEAFFTGTAAEITPIASVDGIDVGEGCRGPITKQLQDAFFALVQGKLEDKWGWLTPVK
ncbi:branched-chain amino acid transaminase [Anaerobiospirillum sp. NML120448]|uniref:branched-chain amino acid transaminase n=1 Tax=Anaerobiospirillum sp. NML120448 TaxID=2932816 RepID=UPI001FF143FA|nr:branched-chain amino acid transaminase [Anaerobiospirillum sp. NML120448]MCK0513518.1 branched-chain amino acid transaminase [Anaerobiospirillum sp. NML120448]